MRLIDKRIIFILHIGLTLLSCNSQNGGENPQVLNKIIEVKLKKICFKNFEDNSTCEVVINDNRVTIIQDSKETEGTIVNGIISTESCSDCYRIGHGDDGEGWVLEKYDNDGNFENVYYFSEKNPMGSFEKLTSLIENGTKEKQTVNSNSSFQSLGEIRTLVLSASLRIMKKRLGEPDESMGADDYLLKYHNWKPFSVYSSNRTLYSLVFVYENLLEKPIVVIFNNQSGEVFDVMYKDDIKSFEDLAVNFRYH